MREAYPKPDDPTFLRAMCRKCGDIIDFASLDDDFRTCRRGHSVFHPIGKDVRKPYRPTCPNCKVPMIRSRVDGSRSYIWRCSQCRKLAISEFVYNHLPWNVSRP